MSERIQFDALVERYGAFLLDGYGVLVTEGGALPGAAEALARLERAGRRWLVVSNDASRLPETSVARYRSLGLPVERERLLTSGDLIADHFAQRGLVGQTVVVLGTEDSRRLVTGAGGLLAEPGDRAAAVVVIGDDDGYAFREAIEATLDAAAWRVEHGEPLHLVLPNPDVVFPRGGGHIGLAAGAIALLIEAGLRVRFGPRAPRFTALGKPGATLFAAALARLGGPDKRDVVMVGDQLATDIRGAVAFGIDAVLVGTGLTPLSEAEGDPEARPTWLMDAFAPEA